MHMGSVLGVRREQAVTIGWFEPDTVEDMSVGSTVELEVKEADRIAAAGCVELDVWIQAVEMLKEGVQSL